jgi:hypothetical protein
LLAWLLGQCTQVNFASTVRALTTRYNVALSIVKAQLVSFKLHIFHAIVLKFVKDLSNKMKASYNQQSAIIHLPNTSPTSHLVPISIPDWLTAPSIQYDSGANILASPSAPFNGRILPSTDVIDIADGTHILISGTSILGSTNCLIAPSFTTTLVLQSFLVKFGCAALLYDNNLNVIDCKLPQIRQLLDQIPFIHAIPAENDLYYFAQQKSNMGQRQLPSTKPHTVTPAKAGCDSSLPYY